MSGADIMGIQLL